MRQISVLILIFICSLSKFSQTMKPTGGHDGYYWEERNELEKLLFLDGFIYGVDKVREFVLTGWVIDIANGQLRGGEEEKKRLAQVAAKAYSWIGEYYDCHNIPYGQIVNGIDDIYKDYANKRVELHLVIKLVTDKIKGRIDEKGMEQRLVSLRQQMQER